MKPFHIDRELECPILFKDVLFKNVISCLRTPYPVLERPNTVLEHPVLERPKTVLECPKTVLERPTLF